MSFGVGALVLAGAGLYGVMAFSVRRRTQEIGVRMALGAARSGVIRMILWQGMWRVGLGIVIGLVPAWFLAGQMRALLTRVSQFDPLVFGLTILLLVLAGAAATIVPALRAASVDPLVALAARVTRDQPVFKSRFAATSLSHAMILRRFSGPISRNCFCTGSSVRSV